MNALGHREFACAIIIDTLGRFLLQQRDNVPDIVLPGTIGLFGGHRESGETFLQCVVREVHEEIGYFAPPERFRHLGSYRGGDAEVKGGTVRGEYYVVGDVPADAITVTEGSLVIAEREDLPSLMHQLTPSAQAAIGIFFSEQQGAKISN